jgi:hypothetical protein
MLWNSVGLFKIKFPFLFLFLECDERMPPRTAGYKVSQSITRMTYELGASMGMWWFEKTEVYGDNAVIELRNPPQNFTGFHRLETGSVRLEAGDHPFISGIIWNYSSRFLVAEEVLLLPKLSYNLLKGEENLGAVWIKRGGYATSYRLVANPR